MHALLEAPGHQSMLSTVLCGTWTACLLAAGSVDLGYQAHGAMDLVMAYAVFHAQKEHTEMLTRSAQHARRGSLRLHLLRRIFRL